MERNPKWFSDQPIATQTAFAQLQQTALQVQSQATIAHLKGSFSFRFVKGKKYWYYQFNDIAKGRTQQVYLGPDSPEIRALAQAKQEGKEEARVSLSALSRQARICSAAGAQIMPSYHLKLIKQLVDYGFFHAGGVVAGSHAFAAYSNMLGVKWLNDTSVHTLDVDFAHAGNHLSLLLPSTIEANIPDAIASLNEGFLPLMNGQKQSGTWVHPQDPDYRIDFLTPKGRDDGPIECPRLGLNLTPLKFMEFSLEDVEQTVMFDRTSAVVVNLPSPARYAVHKLIVFGERSGPDQVKSRKDLMQSAALIEVLGRDRPHELAEAWNDAWERGPGWRRRLEEGRRALLEAYPATPLGVVLEESARSQASTPTWMPR